MNDSVEQPITLPPVTQALISSPEGLNITVTTQTPQLWFKMLRSIVTDGTWARMLDRHRCVLIVMLEARDEEGTAYLPREPYFDREGVRRPGLYQLTGLKRTALSQAIDDLCRVPSALGHLADPGPLSAAAGLLARDGPDRYHVLPGRVFAGRRPPPPTSTFSHAPPGRQFCRSDDNPDRPGGRFAAGAADAAPSHREARARQNSEKKNSSSIQTCERATTTTLSERDQEEAVGLLVKGCPSHRHGGFSEEDALAVLRRSGATLAKVRTAVLNAQHQAGRRTTDGKPGIRNWRGYVRTQLEGTCTLFPQLERDQSNAIRVSHRIAHCAGACGDEESCRVVSEYFTDGRGGGHVGRLVQLIRDPAWAGNDDEAFWHAAYRLAASARD
jgi:hypothetical protein